MPTSCEADASKGDMRGRGVPHAPIGRERALFVLGGEFGSMFSASTLAESPSQTS